MNTLSEVDVVSVTGSFLFSNEKSFAKAANKFLDTAVYRM